MAGAAIANQNANGRMFSTPDQDNDICSCACAIQDGWWYGWCTMSNINADTLGGFWYVESASDVEFSRMLVKVY